MALSGVGPGAGHYLLPMRLRQYPDATGFLVGFLEWSCILALAPHLDIPQEQTVGTRIDVTHEAATPPGFEVTARVELVEMDGRRLVFDVEAHDGVETISRGRHERFVINREKFDSMVEQKDQQHKT